MYMQSIPKVDSSYHLAQSITETPKPEPEPKNQNNTIQDETRSRRHARHVPFRRHGDGRPQANWVSSKPFPSTHTFDDSFQ